MADRPSTCPGRRRAIPGTPPTSPAAPPRAQARRWPPAAMEAAVRLFRDLGAVVEEVTLRPLRSYSDVKIVAAESELFSLHLPELISRPHDFGQDFRARSLAACLFTAEDYVRASRE